METRSDPDQRRNARPSGAARRLKRPLRVIAGILTLAGAGRFGAELAAQPPRLQPTLLRSAAPGPNGIRGLPACAPDLFAQAQAGAWSGRVLLLEEGAVSGHGLPTHRRMLLNLRLVLGLDTRPYPYGHRFGAFGDAFALEPGWTADADPHRRRYAVLLMRSAWMFYTVVPEFPDTLGPPLWAGALAVLDLHGGRGVCVITGLHWPHNSGGSADQAANPNDLDDSACESIVLEDGSISDCAREAYESGLLSFFDRQVRTLSGRRLYVLDAPGRAGPAAEP